MKDFAKWENTRNGTILALITTLLYIPSAIYFFKYSKPHSIIHLEQSNISTDKFLIGYIFIIFVVILISSIFGFAWAKKYGAKGFGSLYDIFYGLKYILIGGVFSGIVYYLLYTKRLYNIAPDTFPDKVSPVVIIIISNSIFEEVLFRFGIFSWWLRVIPKKFPPNQGLNMALITSVISCTIISINQIYFSQGKIISEMLINLIIANLIFNLIQHIIYIKYGLVSSILSHIISYLRILLLF